jgi:hypothetical protein
MYSLQFGMSLLMQEQKLSNKIGKDGNNDDTCNDLKHDKVMTWQNFMA